MKAHRLVPPRYVNVPVAAVFDAELSDGPARTYARLCGLAWESRDEDKTTPPLTVEELAALCNLRRSAIWLHLRVLRDRGYIEWRTTRGRLVIRILNNSVQNFGLTSHDADDVVDENLIQQQQQQQQTVVQNSGLVQSFGLEANAALNLAALGEYGVDNSPCALEVAALAHVTPDLVRAWGEYLRARPGVSNLPGLLLHVLRNNTRPPREEHRGGPRARARVELPEDVDSALVDIGLTGNRAWQEVADAFAADPERVRAWLEYVRRQRNSLSNAAGFLLEMLRNGGVPPAAPAVDGRRYISGEYADLIQH